MKYLTVKQYQKEEIRGKTSISNRFIRAFAPTTFIRGGFPDRVNIEQELVRYIDSQHSECFEKYYIELCQGITKQEADLILKTAKKIYDMTREQFAVKIVVKAPLLAALFCKRIVDVLSDYNVNSHVLELGAGSGMVGALLLEAGYRYSCTEVTQAFYLAQNRVLGVFNKVNELCIEEMEMKGNYHIPYWKMWELRDSYLDIDIITCNHALLEMSNSALLFYLKFSYNSLIKKGRGFFFFQGTGWNIEGNIRSLLEMFRKVGFQLVYYNVQSELAIFSITGDDISEQVIEYLNRSKQSCEICEHISGHGNVRVIRNDDRIFYNTGIGKKIHLSLDEKETCTRLNFDETSKMFDLICPDGYSLDDEFTAYIKLV